MSASYLLVITQPAEKDLRDIASYVANELLDPDSASRLIAQIAAAIGQLEQLPLRNGLVRDERLSSLGIRTLQVDSYIVFYVVVEQEQSVTIIRILNGRRNWSSLL